MAKCVCLVRGDGGISGILHLSQITEDAPTIVEGEVRGLAPGKHGISVHVYGDLSDASTSCGGIFNPFGKNHGGPDDAERKAGDLGNILTSDDGSPTVISLEDKIVKLIGPQSIIGRSIVVHANEDDCGRGGHELSLVNGNTGMRLASGVIGISTVS
mmetsp:Transcript_59049/g.71088  ORF Transcript_59049/g.71088 Transcript_59049/m.71088 type:complete len:157 (-) Transcript_59049:425-895(-)